MAPVGKEIKLIKHKVLLNKIDEAERFRKDSVLEYNPVVKYGIQQSALAPNSIKYLSTKFY